GEILDVLLLEADLGLAGLARLRLGGRDHLLREIEAHHLARRAHLARRGQAGLARARRDVDDPLPLGEARLLEQEIGDRTRACLEDRGPLLPDRGDLIPELALL